MSHFGVLVIGNDIEKQLAPYHEFESTGRNDQFVQDVDITDQVLALMTGETPLPLNEALNRHGLADKVVANESEVNKIGDECEHKYGYAIVRDGELVKAVDRTNPRNTWDWWMVGGLKLKPGAQGTLGERGFMGFCASDGAGRADIATVGAVDFAGMRDDAGVVAAAEWDKAFAARQGADWVCWVHMRDVIHGGDIDAARAAYDEQPAVRAMRKVFDHPFHDLDRYAASRGDFVQCARDSATVLYAIVADGRWAAKGDGWFGMSTDRASQEDWNLKVNTMLDALPEDTLLTVVDCHI